MEVVFELAVDAEFVAGLFELIGNFSFAPSSPNEVRTPGLFFLGILFACRTHESLLPLSVPPGSPFDDLSNRLVIVRCADVSSVKLVSFFRLLASVVLIEHFEETLHELYVYSVQKVRFL